jgi:serine/threonine-protein kinase
LDPDVLQLVREERILDAARLSSSRGDASGASALFERACDWHNAAVQALRAGEAPRGLELALLAGDDATALEATTRVATDAYVAEGLAAHLAQRGRHDWAARLLEAIGRDLDAARAWERAGEMTRAARRFERAGEPARAAQALEVQLRRDPEASEAALALGALLVRFGKDEAAVRALQRIARRAPEWREALTLLTAALGRLGWDVAASDAATELAALGGPLPAPEGPPPASPPRFYGRYEVIGAIASSARARVLEGYDRARGERVAIKIYADGDRAALARLEADVRALRAVDHLAIVPIRDFQAAGRAVVLAWMEGGTLETMLARGPLSPARAAEIVSSVLSALGEANRLGILHRDVKASNVLFDAAGNARLSDFGAAHAADAAATVTAGDLGALAGISPEQREGRDVTARSDLFAVGVLFEQMLTGTRPGPAARPLPSAIHSGLDARHDRLLARMTATDPQRRPADAFQARDAILCLPWPGPGPGMASPGLAGEDAPGNDPPEGDRVERRPDGTLADAWTGRLIDRVPLSDETLERARLFARADHPALQPVLRVDRETGALWLAALAPLDRPLTPPERERLESALAALQAAGGRALGLDQSALAIDLVGDVFLRF